MTRSTTTKRDTLLRLLRRKAGITRDQLGKELGWQPHSVRAAISGLRKAGHTIERLDPRKDGEPHRWRIGAPPSADPE